MDVHLTLIGKSWKTHPKIFQNFSFPGHESDHITGKFIHFFLKFKFRGYELDRFLEN